MLGLKRLTVNCNVGGFHSPLTPPLHKHRPAHSAHRPWSAKAGPDSLCLPFSCTSAVRQKQKRPGFCLTRHKSIVYRGSHFPFSSDGPKKNICFVRGSPKKFFPLSQTVTETGHGVPEAGCFRRPWVLNAPGWNQDLSILRQDASLPLSCQPNLLHEEMHEECMIHRVPLKRKERI